MCNEKAFRFWELGLSLNIFFDKKCIFILEYQKSKTLTKMRYFIFLLFLSLSLFSCVEDEPCDTLACMNDGVCINGVCDCPEGFSGETCENIIEPTTIDLTKITLTTFIPLDINLAIVDNDPSCVSGLKMRILNADNIIYDSNTLELACIEEDHEFEIINNISFVPNRVYTFELLDIDDEKEVLMSTFPYIFRQFESDPFREIFFVSGQSSSTTFELEVDYNF